MINELDDYIVSLSSPILELAEKLRRNPETGFNEAKTGDILAGELAKKGISCERGLALTGIKASIGPSEGPEIVLLADLDALPTHGVEGGVAHSCGHYAQATIMLSVFLALADKRVPERESFRLSFVGAPAEEYVELETRLKLRDESKIRFLSGKQEMIRLGVFDKACCVLKYHSMSDSAERSATVNGTLDGFAAKRAVFIGKAAHAGAHPEDGINALNAASLALSAINAQRETFTEKDHARVHPILVEGGTVVNSVPERAVMEMYIRGADHKVIKSISGKVDRSLAAGAIAVGAGLAIQNTPGYQAFHPFGPLGILLGESARKFVPDNGIDFHDHSFASDDIGDVATLCPTCQLGFSGFSGTIHGADFAPTEPLRAYMTPIRIFSDLVLALGGNSGKAARGIRDRFVPAFSKEGYLALTESGFTQKRLAWGDGAWDFTRKS
jgi:amidohydrolase